MSAGPADKVLDTFKSLVFDELVKAAIAKIISQAAFLAWGPVAYIVGQVVTYVAGVLYEYMSDVINLEVILLKNSAYHAAYIEAHFRLQKVAKEKGIESPEFKTEREKHKAALSRFVRYGGVPVG